MIRLALLLSLLSLTTASITVIDSGRKFPSVPDKKLGQQLWKGYQYMGRLQYIPSNLQLCDGSTSEKDFQIVMPQDSLPVALLVEKGGCTLEEKARVASTKINPPNSVSYLIVQDEKKKLSEDEEIPASIPNHSSLLRLNANNKDDVVIPVSIPEISSPVSQGTSDDTIKVAILMVGQKSFTELLQVAAISTEKQYGGPKITLDSKEPNERTKTLFLWTTISMLCFCCACFCIAMFWQGGFYEPSPQTTQPTRPVRRRLTIQQVREAYPSFHYHPPTNLEEGDSSPSHNIPLDTECSICLDEYLPGVRLRQLPCQHVFHSTCICRWLVERHAVCPLCKVDLYESEDEESSSSSSGEPIEAAPEQPTPTTTTVTNEAPTQTSSSWWSSTSWSNHMRWFSRPRRRQTEGGMVLTELTEPLISSTDNDDTETPSTQQQPDATTTSTEQAASLPEESASPNHEQEEQTTTSTPVEV
jgi:hypothetical protein